MNANRTLRLATAGVLAAASMVIVGPSGPATAGEIGADDVKLTTGEYPIDNEIAYDPVSDQYLVVWTDGDLAADRIRGVIVSGAGAAGTPFTIVDTTTGGLDTFEASVAANTTTGGWMVAYITEEVVGAREVAAASVSAAGAVTVHGFIGAMGPANDGLYDARRPDIAYNSTLNEFLVVWNGDDDTAPFVNGQDEIFGQRLSAAGAEVGTDDANLTANTFLDDEDEPVVAYDSSSNRYVIVFETFDAAGAFEFRNVTVDGTLGNATAATDMTGAMPFADVVNPEVASGPGGTVFAFEGVDGSGLTSVWAGTINSGTGAFTTPIQISGAPSPGFEADDPELAYNPSTQTFSIVWEGERSGVTAANEEEVFSTIVDGTLSTIEPIERISTMGVDGDVASFAFSPVVATNAGAGYYVVWSGDNPDPSAGANQTTAGDAELFGQAVAPTADLSITSVTTPISPSPPLAGSAVRYSVAISNAGPADASGVTVTATVPTGLVIDGVTAGNLYTGNVPGTIAAAGSTSLTVNAQIAAGATKGTALAPTFTVNAPAGTADPTGNNSGTAATITVDGAPLVTAFTVASDGPDAAYATSGDTVTASITTDEDITTPTVTIGGVTVTATGSGSSWTASLVVDGTTAEGAAAGQVTAASDLAGIAMVVPVTSSNSVTVDRTAPTPTIASSESDPTSTSPFDVTVDFGEDVLGFTSGDVIVVNGTVGAATGGTDGSYTVPITPTGDGLVTVDLGAGAAADLADNASGAAGRFSITYDGTAPAPVITSAEPDPTSTSPFDVSIDFGEPVTGFADSDIVVGNGSVTNLVDDGGGAFTATIAPAADGSVTVDVAAAVASDAAGNANTAATQFSIDYDGTAPTVTVNQATGQSDPTNDRGTVEFTVVFSEAVSGFDGSDVVVTGVPYLGVTTPTADNTTFTVAVSGISGDGVLAVTVPAGAAVDASGLPNTASTSTDNQVTVDTAAPTSQIVQAAGQADPTNGTAVDFTVTFDEDVAGFDATDVDLSNSTTPGALAAVVTGGPAVFTVTVDGFTGDGVVDARVADGAAADAAGNTSLAMPSPDFQVEVDLTAPTVRVDQATTQADPTNTTPIVFDVVFSEPVTGFGSGGVVIGGSAGAATATVSPVSATEYTIEVTDPAGDGDVTVSVDADAAVDTAGNGNTASTSTDNSVDYDGIAPTVTIEQGATQSDSANASPIVFDVGFSEDVTGFTGVDVALSGTAGATTAVVTAVSADAYTVEVSGMTGDGTVVATVEVGAATDAAGNVSAASTSTDNMVTYISGDVTPGANDAPEITAPATIAAELAEEVAFTGADAVAVTDPDALEGDLVVTLAIDTGELALGSSTGLTVSGDSSAWTLTGTLADLNAALASLTATVSDVGTSTITIGVDDQGNTDGAALTDSATIEITVADTTRPTVVVPQVAVTAATEKGKAGARVNFVVSARDPGSAAPTPTERFVELEPAPVIECTPASGSFFPIGETTVACTATDSSGNVGAASFVVEVIDDEDPVLVGLRNQTIALSSGSSGAVSYVAPTATDNSGSASVVCTPASGSTMTAGTRQVTCTAVDPSGNSSTGSFLLSITSARIPATGGGGLPVVPWALVALGLGGLLALGARRRRTV